MDAAPPAARAARRSGTLLVLALLASSALPALTPSTAGSPAPLVEVVVTSTDRGVAAVAEAVRAAGGTVHDVLPLAGGVSASLPPAAALASSLTVVPNAPIALASKPVASPGRAATAVREALGLGPAAAQGAGVTIAVVDTGVAEAADFGDRLTHVDVTGSSDPWTSHDPYGHGTFVAGVAAGDGSSSGGRFAGVAPGADILDVRVADDEGETDLVTVLRGLEAARAADVINLSMSSGSRLPHQLDPLTTALSRLVQLGKVVVVPTGNDGPGTRSVTSPGVDPRLLTVGALDERLTSDRTDDGVTAFSGRGPAPQGVRKPDLIAPGQSLVSVRSPGSVVDLAHPGAVVDEDYFRGSGTSFSTAAVAGAAAVLLQERPELDPSQVRGLLTSTAYDAAGLQDPRAAGAGGLDVGAAASAAAPAAAPAPDGQDVAVLPAGDVEAWRDFLQAGHRWAGHRWAGHRWAGHRWAGHRWAGHRWA